VTLEDTAPILEVRGACHAYGDQPALAGVDLTLAGGDIYALLGPNGAGKTTLTRAICGRLRLDEGSVRVAGADPHADARARATLGLAPQEIALYPHLTVRENLEVFASLSGVPRRDVAAAVREAMTLTRTLDHADARASRLSGGYRRRVNIAAAIPHRPRLLILDEPTAGVDPTAREAVGAVLRVLAAQGVAVLIVTHDLDEAGDLATRVGFLVEGAMALEGRPADLLAEAFGEDMEILVHMAGEIDAGAAVSLEATGLIPAGAPGAWRRYCADGYGAAARIDTDLRRAGLAVREIRVRHPTLQSLYGRIAETRRAA